MELYYRKEGKGSGAPLVIVHGLYGSSDNWMNIGRQLSEKYTVYMPDLRNHGRSPFSEEHSYEAMKGDLLEFFEKHHIGKATLLGHSMGGKTAMWFAASYPERIERLVVADIAPKDYMLLKDDGQFHPHHTILQAMQEIDFTEIKKREDVEVCLSEKIGDERTRQFLLKNVKKDKETNQYKWRINVDVLYNNLEEIISGVNKNWLGNSSPPSSFPVVFIRGMKSRYILPEDKTLIKGIYPGADIIDIADAGHWLHAEQPGRFVDAVMGKNGNNANKIKGGGRQKPKTG